MNEKIKQNTKRIAAAAAVTSALAFGLNEHSNNTEHIGGAANLGLLEVANPKDGMDAPQPPVEAPGKNPLPEGMAPPNDFDFYVPPSNSK